MPFKIVFSWSNGLLYLINPISVPQKGHTRHWSLDMVVRSSDPSPAGPHPQMYLYIQMQLCRRDSLHDWLRDNRKCDARADKVSQQLDVGNVFVFFNIRIIHWAINLKVRSSDIGK